MHTPFFFYIEILESPEVLGFLLIGQINFGLLYIGRDLETQQFSPPDYVEDIAIPTTEQHNSNFPLGNAFVIISEALSSVWTFSSSNTLASRTSCIQ